MITNLHIKNIGIIDEISINLNEGFNVLTGETGAGKSLIIDSLMILCGGRFNKDMIRRGETYSLVEASLFIPNQGYEDDTIIISREISTSGRNLCKINGRMVTCQELKDFMKNMIDIHGQTDNQTILDASSHIKFLDGYSEKEIGNYLEEYKSLYNDYLDINKKISENYGNDREKERKLDLLKYQVQEIENANLKINEDIDLESKRKSIIYSEKVSNGLQEADNNITNGAIENINQAIHSLEKIEQYDDKYSDMVNSLKSTYYELQELSRDISDSLENIDFDEDEQNRIEERYDFIHSLKRKYGNTIEEVLDYCEQRKTEITQIENLDEYINSLKQERKNLAEKMQKTASLLNEIRFNNAIMLENAINRELQDLEMQNARFKVQVELLKENEFNKYGQNKVEFLISTNVGEEFKPLIKIASGGEMSRIMLAIKNVLASVDKVPILIFDEIDTGISGIAANSVGDKMKQISKLHQVICVTHQASIAAKGDYNYYISKSVINDKTIAIIKQLNEQEVINEIARIASGTITKIAINHAKELRKTKLQLVS
jgi:DNA repair protein RecN (Recombination protein N)